MKEENNRENGRENTGMKERKEKREVARSYSMWPSIGLINKKNVYLYIKLNRN